MDTSMQENGHKTTSVNNPKYVVPEHTFLGVEHPFKVQTISKAIESLGGPRRITKMVNARESETYEAQLSLHPGRHQVNNVISGNTSAKSLVCQITVPKLIGKKRKRGDLLDSNELHPHGLTEQAKIVQNLKDHPSICDLQVLGQYNRVHRFRTLPDFAYSTENNRFMRNFNDTFGTMKYEHVKDFRFEDNEPIGTACDLVPPPVFSPHTIPFNYVYQQNITVKVQVNADGEVTTHNEGIIQRSVIPRVAIDIEEVPSSPPETLPSLDSQPKGSVNLVRILQQLFKERPIWSRRAITYELRDHKAMGIVKWLFQYVGYEFATGPWAMTVIRYGIDPRRDPQCRIYQSITLHFDPQPRYHPTQPTKGHRGGARVYNRKVQREDEDGIPGYQFTGKSLVLDDGKTWQVCDLKDPLLCAILSTKDVRSTPELDSDGWFKNGTWAKTKVIFRYKARALLKGDDSWREEDFVQAAEMPDEFNAALKDLPIDYTGWSRRAILIAFHIKHGSLTFGRNRNTWASHDVSQAVMEALKQHDVEGEATGADNDSGEQDQDLEELLQDDQDILQEGSGSDGSEDDEDEEDEDDEADDIDDMADD